MDLLQQDVDVFPGVQNRSMSKIVNREAEFLGGNVFTVKDKNESVGVRACLYVTLSLRSLQENHSNHLEHRYTISRHPNSSVMSGYVT